MQRAVVQTTASFAETSALQRSLFLMAWPSVVTVCVFMHSWLTAKVNHGQCGLSPQGKPPSEALMDNSETTGCSAAAARICVHSCKCST